MRNHGYYTFRMAQARELEPDDWSYFKGKGQNFSDGKSVEIQGETHKIPRLGRVIKKPLATALIISIFFFVYLFIAISSYINVEIVFSFNNITLAGRQILKIISIALALLGTFFLTFGLKLVQSYSKQLNSDLKIDEKKLIAPSFVSQRTYSIIIGLCMIMISASIQLAIVMWK
ncbi:hypothetical protein KA005_42885 [bacterium]|nr:hypothetical protein [bacterium]